MFANLKKDPSIGRSEALRRSMMKLAANDNSSHPVHWAPFSLVGEGAVPRYKQDSETFFKNIYTPRE